MHILLKDILSEAITDNPNFKRWFNNSVVLDSSGNPMKMYHGTTANKAFDIFNTSLRGAWFTANPSTASGYTKGYKQSYSSDGRRKETEYVKKYGRVLPVYLSIQNPKEYTSDDLDEFITTWTQMDNNYYKKNFKELLKNTKLEGHDGLVFKSNSPDKDIYVAFDPTQIKSIYNSGEFDPNNPDIGK